MRYYSAKQRVDGRYDYTCGLAIGYCREYKPFEEEDCQFMSKEMAQTENEKMKPFIDKFHSDGHATVKEACECYKQYLLDHSLTLMPQEPENASSQHRCRVCNKFTACHATVGPYRIFVLCPEHQSVDSVSKLLEIGESWAS